VVAFDFAMYTVNFKFNTERIDTKYRQENELGVLYCFQHVHFTTLLHIGIILTVSASKITVPGQQVTSKVQSYKNNLDFVQETAL
jgi:hypothetical protein